MTEELKIKIWHEIMMVCQEMSDKEWHIGENMGYIMDKYTNKIIHLIENEEQSS